MPLVCYIKLMRGVVRQSGEHAQLFCYLDVIGVRCMGGVEDAFPIANRVHYMGVREPVAKFLKLGLAQDYIQSH